MSKGWFILRVASGEEVGLVHRFNLPAYIPHRRYDRYNRKLRRNNTFYKPAFPGYIFVPDNIDATYLAQNVKGVYGYLREGNGERSRLTEKTFALLREIESELMLPRSPVPEVANSEREMFLSLCLGARVKIDDGPFAGKQAIVGRVKETSVLVRLIGAKHPVEVPKKDVHTVAV